MKNILFTIILIYLITIVSFINAEEENLSKYCSKERCTEQITQLRIGKFSFTADNCAPYWITHNDDNACILRFGINGSEITKSFYGSFSYRVINGPMPFSLGCSDGQNHGFADLDLLSLEGQYGINTYDDRYRQFGERVYYHNPPDKTFIFFQEYESSIGILINEWGATGHGSTELFIFDTETGESTKLNGDCGGWYRSASPPNPWFDPDITARFNSDVVSCEKGDDPHYQYLTAQMRRRSDSNSIAFKCYAAAAQQGYTDAFYALGMMYLEGLGVKKNNTKALMWFEIATSLGSSEWVWKQKNDLIKNMRANKIKKAKKLAQRCINKSYRNCG